MSEKIKTVSEKEREKTLKEERERERRERKTERVLSERGRRDRPKTKNVGDSWPSDTSFKIPVIWKHFYLFASSLPPIKSGARSFGQLAFLPTQTNLLTIKGVGVKL